VTKVHSLLAMRTLDLFQAILIHKDRSSGEQLLWRKFLFIPRTPNGFAGAVTGIVPPMRSYAETERYAPSTRLSCLAKIGWTGLSTTATLSRRQTLTPILRSSR
jgi:hypothetical protein